MRNWTALALILALMLWSFECFAQEEDGSANKQVGLGAIGGVNIPIAKDSGYEVTECWGFYTDIPVISTFHVSPQVNLWRIIDNGKKSGAADLDLNFKFVIPLPGWKIFLSALLGLSTGDYKIGMYAPHLGGNLGFTYRMVSNLDLVIMFQYKFLVDGTQHNVHQLEPLGGLQFNF